MSQSNGEKEDDRPRYDTIICIFIYQLDYMADQHVADQDIDIITKKG